MQRCNEEIVVGGLHLSRKRSNGFGMGQRRREFRRRRHDLPLQDEGKDRPEHRDTDTAADRPEERNP